MAQSIGRLISLALFCWFLSTSAQAFESEQEVKDSLKNYIQDILGGGHGFLSYEPAFFLSELSQKIDDIHFIFLGNAEFSQNVAKTRRSAFYTMIDGRRVIMINKDAMPSEALLLHELIKDRHYEISNSFQILQILNREGAQSNYDPLVGQAVEETVNELVNRFGIEAASPHQWVDPQVQDMDKNNSSMGTDSFDQKLFDGMVAPGGDISGGGGDGGGFDAKSRVLLAVLRKVAPLYKTELGYSDRSLANKLKEIYFLMTVKIYFETSYVLDIQDPIFHFGTDSIERLLFFPYMIQVPSAKLSHQQVEDIAEVILQSDLFREIPSLMEKYNSQCSCVQGKTRKALPYLCPDPSKLHVSIHHLTDFYQRETEKSMNCKLEIGTP